MHYTDTLPQRLRALADELESAERYGIPLPYMVSVAQARYTHATFHADPDVFDAWADYCEVEPVEYESADNRTWRQVITDINGLKVEFATATPVEVSA
jgi:hypothetical protein